MIDVFYHEKINDMFMISCTLNDDEAWLDGFQFYGEYVLHIFELELFPLRVIRWDDSRFSPDVILLFLIGV
jgi:hypothetical protein